MLTCSKRWDHFPFAHRVPTHTGHCRFVHGHSWSIEVEFEAMRPDTNGFVLDFCQLKELRAELDHMFDHTLVVAQNDPDYIEFEALDKAKIIQLRYVQNPSSEGIAEHVFNMAYQFTRNLERNVRPVRVTVWEDSRNSATYRP